MLPGKQYFKADGNQIAVYFMEIMTTTQGAEGSYSHRGTKNMDEGGRDQFIDPAFAPFDGTITWKQTTSSMTGILFSSDKPVWTRKYGLVFVNLLMWHDNNTADLFKGKKIKQGEHLYDEGTAGDATGNHIHYAVSIGKFAGGYPLVKNEFGNWELPGEVNAWDVFFVNDTIIRKSGGYDWQIFQEIPEMVKTIEEFEVLKPTLKGDRVRIIGTHYATGQLVPLIVKSRIYTVDSDPIKTKHGDKVVLKEIQSYVFVKDLRKV